MPDDAVQALLEKRQQRLSDPVQALLAKRQAREAAPVSPKFGPEHVLQPGAAMEAARPSPAPGPVATFFGESVAEMAGTAEEKVQEWGRGLRRTATLVPRPSYGGRGKYDVDPFEMSRFGRISPPTEREAQTAHDAPVAAASAVTGMDLQAALEAGRKENPNAAAAGKALGKVVPFALGAHVAGVGLTRAFPALADATTGARALRSGATFSAAEAP